VILPLELVTKKIADHQCSIRDFVELLEKRVGTLQEESAIQKNFVDEMSRFLPPQVISRTVQKEEFWIYLTDLLQRECGRVVEHLDGKGELGSFEM
jgi:hypothetical protein